MMFENKGPVKGVSAEELALHGERRFMCGQTPDEAEVHRVAREKFSLPTSSQKQSDEEDDHDDYRVFELD